MPAIPLSSVLARCSICGAVFSPVVGNNWGHCSRKCMELAAKRRAALMRDEASCEYCGTAFPNQRLARKTGRRYCNKICYGNARVDATSRMWMARADALVAPQQEHVSAVTMTTQSVATTTQTVVYDGVEFEVLWTGATINYGERGGLLPPREQKTEKLLGGPDSEEEQ